MGKPRTDDHKAVELLQRQLGATVIEVTALGIEQTRQFDYVMGKMFAVEGGLHALCERMKTNEERFTTHLEYLRIGKEARDE